MFLERHRANGPPVGELPTIAWFLFLTLFALILTKSPVYPAATPEPAYAPWDFGDTTERFDRDAWRERGLDEPAPPRTRWIDLMFDPFGREFSHFESGSVSERQSAINLVDRVLRYPYVSNRAIEAVACYRSAKGSSQYAYKCILPSLTQGRESRTYRVFFYGFPWRARYENPRVLIVYIDGLREMRSPEDVKARVCDVFEFEGELVAERPLVPSPRTFTIKSKDDKWHFRGGRTTLVSGGDDDPTTTVVNAIAAHVYRE